MQGQLRLVASPAATDGSLAIHQDARVYLSSLAAGASIEHALAPGRHAWLQVLRGRVNAAGTPQAAGTDSSASDGLAVSEEKALKIVALEPAEIMLFDLA